MKTKPTTAPAPKPVRLRLQAAAFSTLRETGSALFGTKPRTKAGAALQPGTRIEAAFVGDRSRKPRLLSGCIVGRVEDHPEPVTLPPGVVPVGHRGPLAVLSLVTDDYAKGLAATGPLSSVLPHYVGPGPAKA